MGLSIAIIGYNGIREVRGGVGLRWSAEGVLQLPYLRMSPVIRLSFSTSRPRSFSYYVLCTTYFLVEIRPIISETALSL